MKIAVKGQKWLDQTFSEYSPQYLMIKVRYREKYRTEMSPPKSINFFKSLFIPL